MHGVQYNNWYISNNQLNTLYFSNILEHFGKFVPICTKTSYWNILVHEYQNVPMIIMEYYDVWHIYLNNLEHLCLYIGCL